MTYQVLRLTASLNADFYSISVEAINYASYVLIATQSLIVAILVCIEINHLEDFNIDKFTILTLILFSFPGLILWNNLLLFLTASACVIAIVAFIIKRPEMMKTNLRWALIGIVFGVIAVVFLAQSELLLRNTWLAPHYLQNSLVISALIHIQNEFSFTSLHEEILFRGFIWGYLREYGWKENKIAWAQGILFWFSHFGNLVTPFSFFVAVPIVTMISSQLTKRSKQVFPSILSHTIMNAVSSVLSLATF